VHDSARHARGLLNKGYHRALHKRAMMPQQQPLRRSHRTTLAHLAAASLQACAPLPA
jgi:hypothetical protein